MSYKRYWVALAIVIIGSFAVLGGVGRKMISEAPPIPDVYNTDGQLLFTGSSITDGQGVWQSIGGQEIGTVWGHGAYVAPDWSADWLHRESEILLKTWAVRAGATNFESLGPDQQAIFKARLIREMRTNTYDAVAQSRYAECRPRCGVSAASGLLHRCLCDRPVSIRHPERCIDQRSKAASTCRILLVDLVGLQHGSTWIRDDLHK